MNIPDKLDELLDRFSIGSDAERLIPGLAGEILAAAGSLLELPYESSYRHILYRFLNETASYAFMQNLKAEGFTNQWAECCFSAIQASGYSLQDMFAHRTALHPDKVLFRDMGTAGGVSWTYGQIALHLREIAAAFGVYSRGIAPRVAIICDNSVESACCDLACLVYGIIVVPLNVQTGREMLTDIFNRSGINIAVADTEERYRLLLEIRDTTNPGLIIFVTNPDIHINDKKSYFLGQSCKKLNRQKMGHALSRIRKPAINCVSTLMFTSGSTGKAKGVAFSDYNLVSKRFARAAALPDVGDNEVLLAYLPLFHTFGRFLEMLGMIYWSGTYVFAGNTSAETLFSLMPAIAPTGFVSIPLRWQQMYEKCFELIGAGSDPRTAIAEVTGGRMRWGISAAGYLDPRVFRFFERHGLYLCSGFGMTEATGGITMTPPGRYIDNSTGIPLPGISVRLGGDDELEISGHYVARYLEDIGPGEEISYPVSADEDYWMSTGDVFRQLPNGYYEIIDRIKDIYKNNRGQTIAPRIVEDKFINVPGIKYVFLVGDGKAYNVLLIVPDMNERMSGMLESSGGLRDYYHKIIDTVNQELAPYERVVNFTVLNREFSRDRGEITPKGSFNRKIIEGNFSEIIEELYKSDYTELRVSGIKVRIPRWFFRDLGLLEDAILPADGGLSNRMRGTFLMVKHTGGNRYRIGSLEYELSNNTLDLGTFALNPYLWCGNTGLMKFGPCREGWDSKPGNTGPYVYYPHAGAEIYSEDDLPILPFIKDTSLLRINRLVAQAYFAPAAEALDAIEKLGEKLQAEDERKAGLIRLRLSALAWHPDTDTRCAAYRILLLDEPGDDYNIIFPPFIRSGLTFLTRKSVAEIARGKIERRRLDALRLRLHNYRRTEWQMDDNVRHQFGHIFQILVNFAGAEPGYARAVRAELANWILYDKDPVLAGDAEHYFYELLKSYKKTVNPGNSVLTAEMWDKAFVMDEDIAPEEAKRLKDSLTDTAFIKYSVELAYDEKRFDFNALNERGVWVSRLNFPDSLKHYRLSINMRDGRHFDLHIIFTEKGDREMLLNMSYRHIAVRSFPQGPSVLPQFGWFSMRNYMISLAYDGGMTLWEKIRSYSILQYTEPEKISPAMWRKIFIRALSVYIMTWNYGGRKFLPLPVTPSNITVPETDYTENSTLVAMTGFSLNASPADLLKAITDNFYVRTFAYYPTCRNCLNPVWIFDAAIEALDYDEGKSFLKALADDLSENGPADHTGKPLYRTLEAYMLQDRHVNYIPLSVMNAVESYGLWTAMNPGATEIAREQAVKEVYKLYRLNRYPEVMRYYLYRHTYFAGAAGEVTGAFDRLLADMLKQREKRPLQFISLTDLQASIQSPVDSRVFSRLVFPRAGRNVEFLRVDGNLKKKLIVRSKVADKDGVEYIFRNPENVSEIGEVYRLFYLCNYPIRINERDRYYMIEDANGRIVGGLTYRRLENKAVYMEGMVVAPSLQKRGLGRAMLEEFFSRLAGNGVQTVKTHFFLPAFLLSVGFATDSRKGAMIKSLVTN